MPKVDANDIAAAHGAAGLAETTDSLTQAVVSEALQQFPSVRDLVQKHKRRMREPLIHGLIRRGETINLVAPPKAGKSILGYHVALSVAMGDYLLGVEAWRCEQGMVVIFDNELHEETLGCRIPDVSERLNYPEEVWDWVRVVPLRGKGLDIHAVGKLILQAKILQPRLVIIDSLYRFLPKGVNENDNGAMTEIYNQLDTYAEQLQTCGIVVIHHTSKGAQGEKDIMDVGSGAGSSGRATDNHIVIREHEDEGHYVIEAKPRSFKSPDPVVCKLDYPLWTLAGDKDATKLKGKKAKRAEKTEVPKDLPPEKAFLPVLNTTEWKSQKQVCGEFKVLLNCTHASAEIEIQKIISKFGLRELRTQDLPRDCGAFEAKREGAALLLRLKGNNNAKG